MLKDGTEDGTGEVEDGTAKTGVVKNQDGRCLVLTIVGLLNHFCLMKSPKEGPPVRCHTIHGMFL